MAKKKHIDTAAELSKPYEENEIRLRGIVGFGIGLFFLIVITFGLMWALLKVLKDYSAENADPKNPLAMTDRERLPPEPRLQLAPGFGVDSDAGRVNMELGAPQAEWRELKKQWEELWKHGHKDAKTGAVSVMPIDQAKHRLMEIGVKAKTGEDADKVKRDSRSMVSDASAGRLAAETRR
jgi:hypothetical protein